jgi:hypothetical protein
MLLNAWNFGQQHLKTTDMGTLIMDSHLYARGHRLKSQLTKNKRFGFGSGGVAGI